MPPSIWKYVKLSGGLHRGIAVITAETKACHGLAEGFDLTLRNARVHVAIALWPWKDYLGKEAPKGVRAKISSFSRLHPNASLTKAKICVNYVNSILGQTGSKRRRVRRGHPSGCSRVCLGRIQRKRVCGNRRFALYAR